MRVLNRIIRVHPRQGITIEPDPRDAEILIGDFDGDSHRVVTTPMTKKDVKESVEAITNDVHEKAKHKKLKGDNNRANNPDKLNDTQATRYRSSCGQSELPCCGLW